MSRRRSARRSRCHRVRTGNLTITPGPLAPVQTEGLVHRSVCCPRQQQLVVVRPRVGSWLSPARPRLDEGRRMVRSAGTIASWDGAAWPGSDQVVGGSDTSGRGRAGLRRGRPEGAVQCPGQRRPRRSRPPGHRSAGPARPSLLHRRATSFLYRRSNRICSHRSGSHTSLPRAGKPGFTSGWETRTSAPLRIPSPPCS
jgi:hypothetical protein